MIKPAPNRRSSSAGTDATQFNALRHGVLSRYTILPWEDENEYRGILDALVAEHKPRGPTEEHLVEEVAAVIWRKRRLRLAEAAAFRRELRDASKMKAVDAALASLELLNKEAGNTARPLADLNQDRASIASALELLQAGKARSYEKALGDLSEEIRERWDKAIRPTPLDLLDFTSSRFPEDADGLLQFLEDDILPTYERRRKELENLPIIREQVIGETLEPDRLEGLCRYELHLDRKLERMLTILIRLRT